MLASDDVIDFWATLPDDSRTAMIMAKDLEFLAESDDPAIAVRAARVFIDRFPLDRVGWEVLLLALTRAGRSEEATTCARRLAAIVPDSPSSYRHEAERLAEQGRKVEAADLWVRIATLEKHDPEAVFAIGDTLMEMGAVDKAARVYQDLLKVDPYHPHYLTRHLQALEKSDNVRGFADAARRAVSIAPAIDGFYLCISRAQRRMGQQAGAMNNLYRALRLVPNFRAALLDLGIIMVEDGDLEGALHILKKTVAYHPDLPGAWLNLGGLFFDMGFVEDGMRCKRRTARLGTEQRAARANIVMHTHYLPSATRADLRKIIADFAEQFATDPADAPPATPRDSDPDRPLRVGLVSSSFHRHPALALSIQAFENLDRKAFRLIAYTGNTRMDPLRMRFEKTATVKNIGNDDDTRLIDAVRQDGIDILIDMAGHGSGSKLHLYAQRLAPVQVKWVGGLFNTTGVPAIDWLIADPVQVPDGDDGWYSERIYRMPNGYVVFDPPHYSPPIWPLPATLHGGVTFGSFNNPVKINDRVVALWARILQRAPGSRLLLKGKRFGVPQLQDVYRERFREHGLDPDRLVMRGYTNHPDHLRTHNEVDIALDPWPYSGGLTTCENLWMGVPVITLPGPTFAGRHAATHLANVGLTDWIVDSEDAYVDLAVSWTDRLDELAVLRRALRQRVAESPLCDGRRFARDLETALRVMWRAYLTDAGLIEAESDRQTRAAL